VIKAANNHNPPKGARKKALQQHVSLKAASIILGFSLPQSRIHPLKNHKKTYFQNDMLRCSMFLSFYFHNYMFYFRP